MKRLRHVRFPLLGSERKKEEIDIHKYEKITVHTTGTTEQFI